MDGFDFGGGPRGSSSGAEVYLMVREAAQIVRDGDFRSPPGKAVFYSGSTTRASRTAHALQNRDLVSMTDTPGGRALLGSRAFKSGEVELSRLSELWCLAMRSFAMRATGNVTIVGDLANEAPASLLRHAVLPVLHVNPNVRTVNGSPRIAAMRYMVEDPKPYIRTLPASQRGVRPLRPGG